jgi:hypothetical protein
MGQSVSVKDLDLHIISPSSYGRDGRLLQYHRVLMQPPVFSVLKSLALEAGRVLGITMNVSCINERLQKGEDYLDHIIAAQSSANINLVFISAKSFELSRAVDIARKLRNVGIEVVLGGPGITLTDWKTYDYLVSKGISFNVGEGELTVGQIIRDVISGELRPSYWQKKYVNLRRAPLPCLPEKKEHKATTSHFASIGTSEGCPFDCSFCCVMTLRGRKMIRERSRDPEAVVEWLKRTQKRGLAVMLTDDNLRRSFAYPELKEGLIKLNERLNGKLYLFIQLDAAPDVVREASDLARMGVRHVFLGLESLDPSILSGTSKKQNKPEQYRAIIDEFHRHRILVNTGWMIGFSNQTPQSIAAEATAFSELVDLAHPYCVTPLPGSRDYHDAVADENIINWDINAYDTLSFVRDWFQKMSIVQAQKAYQECFARFFTPKHAMGGYPGLRWKTLKVSAYGRALFEFGRLVGGRPFHYMMDGPPRRARVWRPKDSFKGFELSLEDLEKKEDFLSSL